MPERNSRSTFSTRFLDLLLWNECAQVCVNWSCLGIIDGIEGIWLKQAQQIFEPYWHDKTHHNWFAHPWCPMLTMLQCSTFGWGLGSVKASELLWTQSSLRRLGKRAVWEDWGFAKGCRQQAIRTATNRLNWSLVSLINDWWIRYFLHIWRHSKLASETLMAIFPSLGLTFLYDKKQTMSSLWRYFSPPLCIIHWKDKSAW